MPGSVVRPITLTSLKREARDLADPAVAAHSQTYFKTGPGQYGEGDAFLGLRVPTLRSLVKKYRDLDYTDALKLLKSEWHEERLLGVLLLVSSYDRGDARQKERIHREYIKNAKRINNWDLVDSSAPQIVGAHLTPANVGLLVKLAKSKNLWERRIAIIATQHFIRKKEFRPTLTIAEVLLEDPEDLIHKAVGWMLREVGNRDRDVLDSFLSRRYSHMPRTMLRYAIERHPEEERKGYLAGTVSESSRRRAS
jgi:3-methyladenine DNA glycosylase AlkD